MPATWCFLSHSPEWISQKRNFIPTASYSLAASLLKQICVESRLTIAASRQKSSEIVLHFPSGQSEASRFSKKSQRRIGDAVMIRYHWRVCAFVCVVCVCVCLSVRLQDFWRGHWAFCIIFCIFRHLVQAVPGASRRHSMTVPAQVLMPKRKQRGESRCEKSSKSHPGNGARSCNYLCSKLPLFVKPCQATRDSLSFSFSLSLSWCARPPTSISCT